MQWPIRPRSDEFKHQPPSLITAAGAHTQPQEEKARPQAQPRPKQLTRQQPRATYASLQKAKAQRKTHAPAQGASPTLGALAFACRKMAETDPGRATAGPPKVQKSAGQRSSATTDTVAWQLLTASRNLEHRGWPRAKSSYVAYKCKHKTINWVQSMNYSRPSFESS